MTATAAGARPARRHARGFTLIDLLITVAIVGILTAIAIPSYSNYLIRSQRAVARAALLQTAQGMERYYTANGSYTTAGGGFPLPVLGGAGCVAYAPVDSGAPRYCVSGAATAGGGFLLTATPCGDGAVCPANAASGFTDPTCDQLTLDNMGNRGTNMGAALVTQCWEQ